MPDSLLILARAFHYGSGMMLVGVVAFRWFVLLPALAHETDETWKSFTPFLSLLHRIFLVSAVTLLASGFLLFVVVSSNMSGSSLMDSMTGDILGTVLFQTQFGLVCQWRIGFGIVFAVLLIKLIRDQWFLQRRSSWVEKAAGVVAAALFVSLAWTGHAAASANAGLWRVLADAAHLLAAAIWPAGLLPFALFLRHARRVFPTPPQQTVLAVTHRFSNLSFLIVGILILTGIINTCCIVGSFSALVTTDYGKILCLKLALFTIILAIAAGNRYHLVPLLTARAGTAGEISVLSRLRRFVLTEFALATAIVLVVSLLGVTPPPR